MIASKETRKIRILRPKNSNNLMEIKLPLNISVNDERFQHYCEKAKSLIDLLVKRDGWPVADLNWLRIIRMDGKQLETFLAALVYQVVENGYPWDIPGD